MLGYRVPWFNHVIETNIGPGGTLHYHKHTKRPPGQHGAQHTPTMIVGPEARHYVCGSILYGAQTQQFRRAA